MTYDEMVSITDEFLRKKVCVCARVYICTYVYMVIGMYIDARLPPPPLPRVSPRVPAIKFFRTSASYRSGTRHSHKWRR